MPTAFETLQDTLSAYHSEMAAIKSEAGPDYDLSLVKCIDGDSVGKAAYITELASKIKESGDNLQKMLDSKSALDEGLKHVEGLLAKVNEPVGRPSYGDGQMMASKSIGQQYLESPAFKQFAGNSAPIAELNIGLKRMVAEADPSGMKDIFGNSSISGSEGLTGGWPSESVRTGIVTLHATRPIQVLDYIPTMNTSEAMVKYVEETVFRNDAAEVGQSSGMGVGTIDGVLPESQLRVEEKQSPVQTVGTILPMTKEQIEDEAMAYGYVNNRLPFMVMQRIDGQVLVGDGTGNNLRGVRNVSGITTQARGSDLRYDAVFKGMIKVNYTGHANASMVVMSPTAWQNMVLERGNDQYFAGGPVQAREMRVWGLPVVLSNALPNTEAIVGDFLMYSILFDRQMVEIDTSDSHQDYFARRQLAIRASARVAFVVLRPSAFCSVTGL